MYESPSSGKKNYNLITNINIDKAKSLWVYMYVIYIIDIYIYIYLQMYTRIHIIHVICIYVT